MAIDRELVATLWKLSWNESAIACVVYRTPSGFELSVESATAVVVRERFDMEPRALARAQMLRDSLKRRGWAETASGEAAPQLPTV